MYRGGTTAKILSLALCWPALAHTRSEIMVVISGRASKQAGESTAQSFHSMDRLIITTLCIRCSLSSLALASSNSLLISPTLYLSSSVTIIEQRQNTMIPTTVHSVNTVNGIGMCLFALQKESDSSWLVPWSFTYSTMFGPPFHHLGRRIV
jgi:hypothetical protein